ncbi:MAG: tetraacyldisaccharide 4'-kinase [Ignavibacteria bacterium]|nr:tetraacyldisaccharide 4'-kinase [Ignavibacteria bacterium]MBP6509193.1 tetraacyldisaccharide 4'-kinase [Candidatus Kapabacteria bacterium]MBK7184638.1 tetraacyldisaccharide 4'-kinase [Ignavibacteria bacterium]MBK7413438.1 tetraacyldisaccharide 4'-kinase [Ignavibacteria bacterium]MBK7576939.1 tetraacyldisaccharide 4'-kinase [Ignavibacteria bacterium]
MLTLLSKVYCAVVARRNAGYDAQRRPIAHVSVPVISVGNISVGGTGKTPVVQAVVRQLQTLGLHPAIVMRGYRRSSTGLLVVHDGTSTRASVAEAGDEAYLHAVSLGVPVVVSKDKVEAATYAATTMPCDVIVVDDGFQHRALHRDLDVVLVDRQTLTGSLLPSGRLREPLASLSRADVVLCMGDVDPVEVLPYKQSSALALSCAVEARSARSIANESVELDPGAEVVAVVGIARPERFLRTLEQLGYRVAEQVVFPDHHRYTNKDVDRLCSVAESRKAVLVTTEKDLVKLRPYMFVNGAQRVPMYVVSIHAILRDDAFSALLKQRTTR